MYHLLSRIPEGINPMLDVLQKYVTDVGFDAVKSIPEASTKVRSPLHSRDQRGVHHALLLRWYLSANKSARHEQDPVKYVQTLLDVYVKFSDVVKTAFENDAAFVASLDKVCFHYRLDVALIHSWIHSPLRVASYGASRQCGRS
jgi:hypothetical protein